MTFENKAVVTYYTERGEDFAGFDISGDPDGDSLTSNDAVRCVFKRALFGNTVPPSGDPALLTIDGLFVDASGNEPARFVVGMTDEQTSALGVGQFITTPQVTLDGGIIVVGSPVLIVVREATS